MARQKFSPSSAHRWMNCPGSWYLEQSAPRTPPGEDAMKGTVVHAIIESMLKDDAKTHHFVGQCGIMKNGWFGCFGSPERDLDETEIRIPITEDMLDNAQLCVDVVNKILARRPTALLFTEKKLDVIPGVMTGYADIIIDDIDNDWACVIDYKNGVGHVEVENNPQLMLYAMGAAIAIETPRGVPKNWTLAVVQPNDREDSRPVRTWKTNIDTLSAFMDDVDSAIQKCKIAMASDDDPKYFVSGSWCQWCRGASRCPAQKKALLKTAQVDLPDLPVVGTNPVQPMRANAMTNDQLAWILDNAGAVENLIKQVKAEAFSRQQSGERIEGYKLVESRTRRKIADPAGLEAAAKREGWDVWDRKIAPLKKLDKEVPKEELKKFVIKPPGVPVMAPDTDKRPALLDEVGSLPELDN